MMTTADHSITAWGNGRHVIDITEDEETVMYSVQPPVRQSSLNNITITEVNVETQPTTLKLQPPVSQPHVFSPKAAKPVNPPPSSNTDEDDDVIEVAKEIEVIVIDDEEEDPGNETKENEGSARTEPNSQPKTQETHPYFWDYRNTFVSPAESSLLTPPTTPSSDSIKDSDLKLKSEEIALNLKAQETLSTMPAAMAVIPSPETIKDEEPWVWLFDSSTSKLTPQHSIQEIPTNLQLSSVLSANNNSSTSTLSIGLVEHLLEGPSLQDIDEDDSCSTLILPPSDLEEYPAVSLTHVSTSTPSKSELPSVRPTEEVSLNLLPETLSNSGDFPVLPSDLSTAVISNNLEVSLTCSTTTSQSVKLAQPQITECTYLEPCATLDTSPIASEKVLPTSQSSLFSILTTKDVSSTIPCLIKLPPNKKIFDCPEIYRACYEKCSPEMQKHWDKIFLHREKIMNVLNKYSNDNVIKSKTDPKHTTLDVTNADNGKIDVQNSTENDRTDKSDVSGLNSRSKQQKLRSKSKHRKQTRGEPMKKIEKVLKKCGTEIKKVWHEKSQKGRQKDKCGVTADNLQNSRHIDSEKDVHPNMPIQSNIIDTPKQSCSLKNVSPREKEKETLNLDAKTKEIRSKDTNSCKIQVGKRCSSGTSSNQNVTKILSTNNRSPTCKKPKLDNYSSEVLSNTNNTDIVSEICGLMDQERLKICQKSSKGNEQNNLIKVNITQQSSKRSNKDELIKINGTYSTTSLNVNVEHERAYLPSTSKQYHERLNNKEFPNTKPVEKLKLTFQKEHSISSSSGYNDNHTSSQSAEYVRDSLQSTSKQYHQRSKHKEFPKTKPDRVEKNDKIIYQPKDSGPKLQLTIEKQRSSSSSSGRYDNQTFHQSVEHERYSLPSTSKQYYERSNNKEYLNTRPGRVEKNYKEVAEPNLRFVEEERGSSRRRHYQENPNKIPDSWPVWPKGRVFSCCKIYDDPQSHRSDTSQNQTPSRAHFRPDRSRLSNEARPQYYHNSEDFNYYRPPRPSSPPDNDKYF